MSEHEHWEELAAGHALDALEPDETDEFTAHLAACARCQAVVGDHSFVASQLGHLAEDEVGAPSWERIRAGVLPASSATVTSLEQVRTRRTGRRWLSAAAAVMLLGGGALAWQTTRSSDEPSARQVALSSCGGDSGCRVVHLQELADLIVTDDAVRLLPTRLSGAPSGKVYVLWQLPRDGRPTMVATLASTSNGAVGEWHALALTLGNTAAFGLSLEAATSVPTQPTEVVAVGSA